MLPRELIKKTKPQYNINNKIFNNNLTKNSKIAKLNTIDYTAGNTKMLPAYSKEWKNTIYCFNQNNLKNLPINTLFMNKLIKNYFDMFLTKYRSPKMSLFKKRRIFMNKIYVSNIDVKHTNQKAKITLYTVNKEREYLKNNYYKSSKYLNNILLEKYLSIHNLFFSTMKNILLKKRSKSSTLSPAILFKNIVKDNKIVTNKDYIQWKLKYFSTFISLNRIFLEKLWNNLIKVHYISSIKKLEKYDLLYSLNLVKFNKKKLLPKLSSLLNSVIGKDKAKKIEYNIVNLKSITLNSDIFTNICATLVKSKPKLHPLNYANRFIRRVRFPITNSIKERTTIDSGYNRDIFRNKYRDLRVLSNLNLTTMKNLSKLLKNIVKYDNITDNHHLFPIRDRRLYNNNSIKDTIFKSINYKSMKGIRVEVKGRLSKRFRADRAAYYVKWKGGLKNVYSAFRGISTVLLRGDSKPQVSKSMVKSTRRIGAFAVKGWIASK